MEVIVSCTCKQLQVEVNFSVKSIFVPSSIYHLTANKKLFLNEIVFRFRKNIESPRTVDLFVHIFWMRSTN